MDEQGKYFLGLDIGTDSVGWCVTDRDYNIIKKRVKRYRGLDVNGKQIYKTECVHLWGSRLFDGANDASSRRLARSSRRRLARRRRRILLLQDIFKPEMDKVDPTFFDRLNNSALHKEDKPDGLKTPYLLFNHEKTDKEFFKKYPTIYHLRKAMIDHPELKFDIREVYLVIAHMIKYRGNFLKEGDMKNIGSDPASLLQSFDELDESLRENQVDEDLEVPEFLLNQHQAEQLLELFKSESGKSILLDKEKEIIPLGKGKGEIRIYLLKLINGSKVKYGDIFPEIVEENEDLKDKSFDFTNDAFLNEEYPSLPSVLGDEKAHIIKVCKDIYDLRVLANILKGKTYLSDAMIEIYNRHHDHLYGNPTNHTKGLKELIKEYAPNQYSTFFRKVFSNQKNELIDGNYATYVGMNDVKGKRIRVAHKTTQDSLYKSIKEILPFSKLEDSTFSWKSPEDKEELKQILKDMEEGNYLPRQNSRNNGVFPYQLNKMEMEEILHNQGKYYPVLLEKAPDFNNPKVSSPKIISLLEYHVPYYVGPITNKEGKNHWVVKKDDNIRITPWNFHEVIDTEKTEKAFIERMKNSCSYLIGEPTLPLNSLLYSQYMLLNEMNNWTINGKPISKEDKEYLMDKVYLRFSKPNKSNIESALKEKYGPGYSWKNKTGNNIDSQDLHATLKPYRDMMDPRGFGSKLWKDESLQKKAEEIIFYLTIFEDKKQVKEQLEKLSLSESQRNYFSRLNYTGWGKLSRKLLEGIKTEIPNTSTGEVEDFSIMDLLWDTNENFMQIYFNENYTFQKQVEELIDIDKDSTLSLDELIDEEYVSPLMKRALRQSIKIVNELKKILHISSFDSYFIETTRENDPNKKGRRTNSRKKQLQEIYKQAKNVSAELAKQLDETTDEALQSKKLFRYFLQLGRDVYTGEEISLDDLKDYDIDHIIPQAKLKDDSILNTVLVRKEENNKKQDQYPIPSSILTEKGKAYVRALNQMDSKLLMPKEKMNRILRTTPLTEEEEASFVNRQLTITNQSVKAVCDILKKIDHQAKIVYSKAGLVSDFRDYFDLLKCRDVNDFHHAHDAYLNIVVGNVYNKVFTSNFSAQMIRENKEHYEGQKINAANFFTRDHTIYHSDKKIWIAKHYILENGNYVEDKNSSGTIDLVRKYMSFNDPMVTQMLCTQKGKGFFNKTRLHSKYEGGAQMPLKNKVPFNTPGFETKYGGYSDLIAPYFMLVQSETPKGKQKGKLVYSLENIPTVYLSLYKTKEEKERYLSEHEGLTNPKIILPKLLIRTIIEIHQEINGKDCHCRVGISGKTGNSLGSINLSEFKVDKKHSDYIRAISKLLGNNLPNGKVKPNLAQYESRDKFTLMGYEISKDHNQELFEYLIQSFKRPEFFIIPELTNILQQVSQKKTDFIALNIIEQMKILSGLTALLSCKSKKINLEALDLTKCAGSQRFNKQLKPQTAIIAQSITGFYEDVLFVVPQN